MVEISMNDKSHAYSKSQAEMVLRDFFSNKGVKSFKVAHRGNSNDSEYCVGNSVNRKWQFQNYHFYESSGG